MSNCPSPTRPGLTTLGSPNNDSPPLRVPPLSQVHLRGGQREQGRLLLFNIIPEWSPARFGLVIWRPSFLFITPWCLSCFKPPSSSLRPSSAPQNLLRVLKSFSACFPEKPRFRALPLSTTPFPLQPQGLHTLARPRVYTPFFNPLVAEFQIHHLRSTSSGLDKTLVTRRSNHLEKLHLLLTEHHHI